MNAVECFYKMVNYLLHIFNVHLKVRKHIYVIFSFYVYSLFYMKFLLSKESFQDLFGKWHVLASLTANSTSMRFIESIHCVFMFIQSMEGIGSTCTFFVFSVINWIDHLRTRSFNYREWHCLYLSLLIWNWLNISPHDSFAQGQVVASLSGFDWSVPIIDITYNSDLFSVIARTHPLRIRSVSGRWWHQFT